MPHRVLVTFPAGDFLLGQLIASVPSAHASARLVGATAENGAYELDWSADVVGVPEANWRAFLAQVETRYGRHPTVTAQDAAKQTWSFRVRVPSSSLTSPILRFLVRFLDLANSLTSRYVGHEVTMVFEFSSALLAEEMTERMQPVLRKLGEGSVRLDADSSTM